MPAAKRARQARAWRQVLYRLFFNNSDEVKRVRFERTVLTGYEIALSVSGLSRPRRSQALSMIRGAGVAQRSGL
jgi:hypothetical protein